MNVAPVAFALGQDGRQQYFTFEIANTDKQLVSAFGQTHLVKFDLRQRELQHQILALFHDLLRLPDEEQLARIPVTEQHVGEFAQAGYTHHLPIKPARFEYRQRIEIPLNLSQVPRLDLLEVMHIRVGAGLRDPAVDRVRRSPRRARCG